MTDKHFEKLWERLSSATNIKHLDYDEAVTIGNVFGQLKCEIIEQTERVQELKGYNTKLLIQKQRDHKELDKFNNQNKLYSETIIQALAMIRAMPRTSGKTQLINILGKGLERELNE